MKYLEVCEMCWNIMNNWKRVKYREVLEVHEIFLSIWSILKYVECSEVPCNILKYKEFEIFLWKKRRFRLRWDSSPGLSIAGRLL